MGVQLFVFLFVVRAGVAAASGCEFDAVYEFDVGAVVKLVGVTGGRVLDEEAYWTAVFRRKRSAVELINDDAFIENRRKGNARREIVDDSVQREVRRRR